MKKLIFLFISFLLIFRLSAQKPKYIFFFIGDGMGLVQAKITDEYFKEQYNDSLSFLRFYDNGFQTTHSASSKVTDSAAAGTALSTGFKTNNGSLCIAPNGKDSLNSFTFDAKRKGYKIGIVTSVSIDHATPAAFYAKAAGRNSYNDIAMQLPNTGFDYFAGGTFLEPISERGNAFQNLKNYGYKLVTSPDSLRFIPGMNGKVCVLDPAKELYYGIDREAGRFTLAQLTKTGIEALFNKKGFFMMVEGGKIDWTSHANDPASTVYETIEFEKAIREALDFYKKHPKETLIIVSADHETGGMALGSTLTGYAANLKLLHQQPMSNVAFEKVITQEFEGKEVDMEHAMSLVEKYYHVGMEGGIEFNGYDSLRLQRACEYINFPEKYPDRREAMKLFNSNKNAAKFAVKDRLPAIIHTMNVILSEKAGIGWTTHSHSGVPVPVYAKGAGSADFNGFYDNTDLSKKIEVLFE
ncbi:MAG TPA: alkaline phosphatase [Saprospirales bacterium]|nr:alkaline phosphatase [Saprospirales bacterium]